MLFDTHVHLTDEKFDADRTDIIARFNDDHILGVIQAATDEADSKAASALAQTSDKIYASAGVHPHEACGVSNGYLGVIETLLKQEKTVALGEIGLDFHYDFSPRDVQQRVFKEQLMLAKDLNMPVIIHSREASKVMLDTLRPFGSIKGVVHCFSGSRETALELIKLGLHLSFTGSLTFENAKNVKDAFLALPLDRVMAETDCPYLSPVPVRGSRNEPKNVRYVLEKMAALKDIPPEGMADINIANAKALFGVLSK